MKKVKLSFPYDWPIKRQTPGGLGQWGDYEFYVNESSIEKFDAWVVFNGLNYSSEIANSIRSNTILITGETRDLQVYSRSFIRQFSHILTNQPHLNHPQKKSMHTGAPWFVGKSFDELITINEVHKTKLISIVTSNKLITDGHKIRYEFAHRIKDYFRDEIDLFGRGILDFEDKWDVLAPYKYNISIENGSHRDYFTEKLNDCFLAFTFPIYYGCPNITEYYDSDSLMEIDIKDFDKSLRSIEKVLNTPNHYELHLDAIRNARSKYLKTYNIFALIVDYLDEYGQFDGLPERIQLDSKRFALSSIAEKVKFKLYKKWK